MSTDCTELYAGKVLRLCREVHTLPNGRTGNFEIVHHSGGAAILPILPDGKVLLICQFRPVAGKMVIEIPAGRRDAGEAPADCARRELEEETGYRVGELIDLGSTLPSVGYTDERIHLFAARELTLGRMAQEDHEFIEFLPLPLDEAIAMAGDGRIDDAKTQLALLLYALKTGCSR
jgi:ADP-ribose pyrophosphatase